MYNILKVFLGFIILLLITANNSFGQTKSAGKVINGISNVQNLVSNASSIVTKIDNAISTVENNNIYKTLVDGYAVKFPFGILPDNGDKKYALVVNSIKFDPVLGMTAEIFMKIPVSSSRSMYFLADAVPLSKDGSLSGDFKLYLLRTELFKVGEGYDLQVNGLGKGTSDSTYVTFNCKGFKDFTLNGSLNFNPNTIVKHSEEGTARDTFALKFYVQADRVANLILKFKDVPAFQFKSLPGFKCTVPELTFDKSDLRNAPEFRIPNWYVDSLKVKDPNLNTSALTSVLWEGVYIPSIKIEIPKSFSEGAANSAPVVVEAKDVIVDQYGITALTTAVGDPILAANIKSFKVDIELVELNLIANKLSKAGVYGGMSFPVCKEDSKLDFGLQFSQKMNSDDLDFYGYANWIPGKPIVANAFGLAQFMLNGCSIAFEYTNKQFYPSAAIDGSMMVMPKSKSASSPIGTLNFEFGNLIISSKSPYVDLGKQNVSFAPSADLTAKVKQVTTTVNNKIADAKAKANQAVSAVNNRVADATAQVTTLANSVTTGFFRLKSGAESKLAKLPVTISQVELIKDPDNGRLGLGMVLGIQLQNSGGSSSSSSNGFGGSAGFKIWTKRSVTTKRWSYAGFDLTKITIGVDQESFKLQGQLEMFENDVVYGKGFCGYLELDVIKKINVKVGAIFGKKKEVETVQDTVALAASLTASSLEAPIAPETTVEYRYWFVDAFASFPGIPLAPGVELNSFTGGLYYHMKMYNVKPAQFAASTVNCKTASGRYFAPDNSMGLGLMAGIGLQSTGGGNAFNGKINFGLQFATGGGLMSLATWGDVGFFDFNFSAPGLEAVGAAMSPTPLDDKTKGESAKRVPSNSSSVSASWFIEYDVPNKTFVGDFDIYMNLAGGLIRGINANDNAGHISIYASPQDWYVYIGKPVEPVGITILDIASASSYLCFGSKLPNPAIAPIPSEIDAKIDIDQSLLSTGGGLSFGARLRVEGYPHINLGLCDAEIGLKFLVLAGFDVLLSHANEDVYCGNEKRGHNRWYATGQAYLYGGATLHASYDCWIASDDFDIFSMYMSAFVFAQLPKPSYMKGEIKVGFSILGESFDESFGLEFGHQCASATDNNDVNFIENITPVDKTADIAVSEKITVTFSKPLENYTYTMNIGGVSSTYRAHLEAGNLSLKSGTVDIPFTYELGSNNTKLVITPSKVLPENKLIDFRITLTTQKASGNSWSNSGKTETKAIQFKTRFEPDTIPVKAVTFSYPLPNMKNFYKDETTKGFVRLATIPVKALKLKTGYQFEIAIFENTVEVDRVKTVTFDPTFGKNNFTFDIPNRRLESGKNYIFKLMKSPKFVNSSQTSTTSGDVTQGALNFGIQDSVILQYRFSTSKYGTFKDKMTTYGQTYIDIFNGVSQLNLSVNKTKAMGVTTESLSEFETDGFYVNDVETAKELFQLGNIQYDNTFLNSVNAMSGSINTAFSSLKTGSLSATTDVVARLNVLMKEANLTCLINGGCSASQVKEITIPKGKIIVPIGYYLPGLTTPTSEYQISVDLTKDIKLPSAN